MGGPPGSRGGRGFTRSLLSDDVSGVAGCGVWLFLAQRRPPAPRLTGFSTVARLTAWSVAGSLQTDLCPHWLKVRGGA